jgi:hypothetical protein
MVKRRRGRRQGDPGDAVCLPELLDADKGLSGFGRDAQELIELASALANGLVGDDGLQLSIGTLL